jgi:hypothetical protein
VGREPGPRRANGDEPSFVSTPVFSGAEVEGREQGDRRRPANGGAAVNMSNGGKVQLYDGRTGEPFDGTITVGYMYILKLLALGGRQDPRSQHRPVLAGDAAAAGR